MDIQILAERGSKTPRQLVQHFGVSRTWIFGHLKAGRLSILKISARKILIPVSEVADLLVKEAAKQNQKSA